MHPTIPTQAWPEAHSSKPASSELSASSSSLRGASESFDSMNSLVMPPEPFSEHSRAICSCSVGAMASTEAVELWAASLSAWRQKTGRGVGAVFLRFFVPFSRRRRSARAA